MNPEFARLRRRLALAGGRPASASSDAALGRRDEAEFRPAALIESPLRHIAIGEPEPWREDVAFLDGTQHVELIGYAGTLPIIAAVVRAAVRLRKDRVLTNAAHGVRRLLIARGEALATMRDVGDSFEMIEFAEADEPHPIRDLQGARGLVDRARAALEIEVAREFRGGLRHPERSEGPAWSGATDAQMTSVSHDEHVGPSLRSGRQSESSGRQPWLIVDGSLAATPEWGRDPRILGVVKSHAMLPFMGPELETYLTLPKGHRTSIFQPESRRVTPLYAWALRLHDHGGRDLFHGLIRVEAPATDETLANVDMISRHLLAERAPLSNDPRSDRLLYGIHDVERYLGAQGG